jgi:Ca-activated chloride channel family protein
MNEFIFARPEFLWGAAAAPLIFVVLVLMRRANHRRLLRFAERSALKRLNREASTVRAIFRIVLFSLALIFVFVAGAQPKYGLKTVPVQRQGVDLLIALDVSRSMETEDIRPNRLQRARISIQNLLDRLAGDRIGMIVFAGEAVLIHPLTTRAAGFLLTLDTLNTDAVAVQGTAIGEAIKTARNSFEENSVKHKVLVLITDGETHDESAVEQARLAAEEGITIYSIGIGTQRGDKIPVYRRNGEVVEYKKENGRYVFSKLNVNLLQELARVGGGRYFHYANSSDDMLAALYNDIETEATEENTERRHELMNDIYQFPLSLAVFLLATAMMIGNRREA